MPQNKSYRSLEDAHEFVKKLGLKNKAEWRNYCKSGRKPTDIPASVQRVYGAAFLDRGGFGWFLGTGNVAKHIHQYRSLQAAREFVAKLGLKGQVEWNEYCKSGRKPADIPRNPYKVYGSEFLELGGFGWFLSTGNVATRRCDYRSLDAARDFVVQLGLKTHKEWRDYCKSGRKPKDIPTSPYAIYGDEFNKNGGLGWFLGTYTVAHADFNFVSLEAAREFVAQLGLKSHNDWLNFCRSGRKPKDIPVCPNKIYASEFLERGGWPWFLGYLGSATTRWNGNALLAYLKSLRAQINHLTTSELFHILNEAGAFPAIMRALDVSSQGSALKHLRSMSEEQLEYSIRNASFSGLAASADPSLAEYPDDDIDLSEGSLHSLDVLPGISSELLQVLADGKVNQLWSMTVRDGSREAALKLLKGKGGPWFTLIRDRFLSEFKQVTALKAPKGWSFRIDGKLTQPNLMQKRVAWLVRERKRVGNWSGTGSGKTLSAILSSRLIEAKLTVVVAANATVDGWHKAIKGTYSDSHVAISCAELQPRGYQYLILNYEKFQNGGKDALAEEIVRLNPDFIVFDEIQFIKERETTGQSQRRGVLHGLVRALPEAYVLGMSATPVVNELREPKAILETILGEDVTCDTRANQPNALRMHYLMQKHGVRFRSEHTGEVKLTILEKQNNYIRKKVLQAAGPAQIEAVLLNSKLELVSSKIRKGVILYVEFVTETVSRIKKFVEALGFSVGTFTGQAAKRDEDLHSFIAGRTDVLIASSAIRVGVDGLQQRCNRLVLLGTPWTSSDWDQLVGRVDRQGSKFDHVEVVHPQINISAGGQKWSWDEIRLSTIKAKRTLANTVLDGVLMNTETISHSELTKSAIASLQRMQQAVELSAA